MRKTNRALAAVLTATFVGATVFAAGPATAAPARPGHAHHDDDGMGPEDSGKTKLPAPPRPAQKVPNERVVTTGETPATRKAAPKTTTTKSFTLGSIKDALVDFFATAAISAANGGATTAAVTTVNATTKTASGTAVTSAATSTAKTLVVYDNTGPYAWLGEDYGIAATNLVSHFGAWTAHPVGSYTAGEMAKYSAVVYVGSTYDEPIPVAFLDDVLAGTKPVYWMYDNIWQLTAHSPDFQAKYGYMWTGFDFSEATTVDYKGVALTRDKLNAPSGLMDYVISDPAKAAVVANAVRADGSTIPWAVKSGNLTYIGEIPFSYVDGNDRYLAFSDMLYDLLAPATATRHRAAVRIEDVGPDADPAELRAVADYLSSKKVPFTVAVYPRYRDPKGVENNGVAQDYTLASKPLVVSALKYMQTKGGTLLMHGYTHQLNALNNPYDGVSANDFEFYLAHVDTANNVIYDGPVTGDSTSFAQTRVDQGVLEFTRAGLKAPTIFEPPHYAASAVDYKVFNTKFGTRYDRGLYFPGVISGGTVDATKLMGQYFPYGVRDVYGSVVIPENLGNIEPEPFNNHPARLPADLVNTAKANLAVRDGIASFFYHPYLGTDYLKQTVEGVQGLGYTFVAGSALTIS
jgi:uncharacterized protein YdaL